jgi:RHS repeat-associated protein
MIPCLPFGMMMPGREYQAQPSRFGFNGKENDNEVKGFGNQEDYGFRIFDPRLGRFLSVDPLTKSFPYNSPYIFSDDDPMNFIDLEGLQTPTLNAQSTTNRTSLRVAYNYRNTTPTNFTIIRGGMYLGNLPSTLRQQSNFRPAPSLYQGAFVPGNVGEFEEGANGYGRYIPSAAEVAKINSERIKAWEEAPMKERANEIYRAREDMKKRQITEINTIGIISEDKLLQLLTAQASNQTSSNSSPRPDLSRAKVTIGGNSSNQRQEEQYSLVALKDGWYPVMQFGIGEHGKMYLRQGEVWKYGTTLDPKGRYTQKELANTGEGLGYVTEAKGTGEQVLLWEWMKLWEYKMAHGGQYPPGNTKMR